MRTTIKVLQDILIGIQPRESDFQPYETSDPLVVVVQKYNGTYDIAKGVNQLLQMTDKSLLVDCVIVKEPKPPKKVATPIAWSPGYWAMMRGSEKRKRRLHANRAKAGKN